MMEEMAVRATTTTQKFDIYNQTSRIYIRQMAGPYTSKSM